MGPIDSILSKPLDRRNRWDGLHQIGQTGRAGTSSGEPERTTAGDPASQKRAKECECLHGISELVERYEGSLPDILQGIVCQLPPSWQYPDICHARLTVYDRVYTSGVFRQSPWSQSAPIRVLSETVGETVVFYQQDMPLCDEGPFLKAERRLIDAVAERTGRIVERYQLREEAESAAKALQEANAALRAVLSQIEEEKAEIHRSMNANVESIILPILRAMAEQIPSDAKQYLDLLEKNLNDLASSSTYKLYKACDALAPAEIEICNMIRTGLSTKEIATLRHVSLATVFKQRESIRRKLSIHGTSTNLTAHLMTMSKAR